MLPPNISNIRYEHWPCECISRHLSFNFPSHTLPVVPVVLIHEAMVAPPQRYPNVLSLPTFTNQNFLFCLYAG